jgi:hypothetical protein
MPDMVGLLASFQAGASSPSENVSAATDSLVSLATSPPNHSTICCQYIVHKFHLSTNSSMSDTTANRADDFVYQSMINYSKPLPVRPEPCHVRLSSASTRSRRSPIPALGVHLDKMRKDCASILARESVQSSDSIWPTSCVERFKPTLNVLMSLDDFMTEYASRGRSTVPSWSGGGRNLSLPSPSLAVIRGVRALNCTLASCWSPITDEEDVESREVCPISNVARCSVIAAPSYVSNRNT